MVSSDSKGDHDRDPTGSAEGVLDTWYAVLGTSFFAFPSSDHGIIARSLAPTCSIPLSRSCSRS